MESIYRDLIIGALGSVIGALIVYFSSYGITLTKKARRKYTERFQKERSLWKTRKLQVRMEITNYYLFEILKDYLIGSILTLIPALMAHIIMGLVFATYVLLIMSGFIVLGIIYYLLALGKVLRYLRIRRDDEDYLDTYLNEEKKEDVT